MFRINNFFQQNNEIMGQAQQLLSVKKAASLKDKLSEVIIISSLNINSFVRLNIY